jgi:hypothetical protein
MSSTKSSCFNDISPSWPSKANLALYILTSGSGWAGGGGGGGGGGAGALVTICTLGYVGRGCAVGLAFGTLFDFCDTIKKKLSKKLV